MPGSKTSVKLNSGFEMPFVGLGTFMAKPNETQTAVENAIDAGYRHFDTAFLYFNEAEVGNAIKKKISEGKVKREEIFVTTKLPGMYMTPERAPLALEKSLKALDIGYIDLYLIHSPMGMKPDQGDSVIFPMDAEGNLLITDVDHAAVWKVLENAVGAGKVKSIGLSNYNRRQIQFILDNCKIKPANLQVECHLYFQRQQLVEFCHKNGISVAAYGPLGNPAYIAAVNAQSGKNLPGILKEPTLEPIVNRLKKTPAQICLRWLIQREIIVLPKSTNPARMAENFSVFDFELTKEDMEALSKLERGMTLYANIPISDKVKAHADYPWGPNDPY